MLCVSWIQREQTLSTEDQNPRTASIHIPFDNRQVVVVQLPVLVTNLSPDILVRNVDGQGDILGGEPNMRKLLLHQLASDSMKERIVCRQPIEKAVQATLPQDTRQCLVELPANSNVHKLGLYASASP